MQFDFPDRDDIRVDTIQISRTGGGTYEGALTDDLLLAQMARTARGLWGDRDDVLFFPDASRSQTVWAWLSSPDAVEDQEAHGSHAFLVFTTDSARDPSGAIRAAVDEHGLRWADVARDFYI